MAGDWIKWSKGLTRKMEILQIAARLHVAPAHAAGVLMQLMEWVDENVSIFDEDGNARVTLGPLQPSTLDVTLGLAGFMESLAEIGWVKLDGDVLVFIHAGRHNGQTAKARAVTNRRVAKHREKINDSTVTHVTPESLQNPLPEKRREDSTHTQGDSVQRSAARPLPESIATPDFRTAWERWLIHWAQAFNHGKAMPEMTELAQLRELSALGAARAIAAIENSITKGSLKKPMEPFTPGQNNSYANNRNGNQRSFEQQQDYSGVTQKL